MSTKSDLNCFYKKTLAYYNAGLNLEFQTSQSLFSSHQVDIGTQHLIKSLEALDQCESILDLGCGYGPLGLWAAKAKHTNTVHLVDRDALAVAYAAKNAQINGVACSAYGSLGYDQVPQTHFDLILSNIPGKAGKAVIGAMLLDARAWLNPGGTVAIVIVTPLEPVILNILDLPDVRITFHEQYSGHTVIHYQFTEGTSAYPEQSSVARNLYDREALILDLDSGGVTLRTARGLAEFESLSYDTQLMLKVLQKYDPAAIQAIHCVNTGIGILPVYLSQRYGKPITLFDRDLLALQFSRQNLIDNGCSAAAITTHHQALYSNDSGQSPDLITFLLRDDESTEIHQQQITHVLAALSEKGTLFLAGGSTAVTRLSKWLESERIARIPQRKRNKGFSVIAVQKR